MTSLTVDEWNKLECCVTADTRLNAEARTKSLSSFIQRVISSNNLVVVGGNTSDIFTIPVSGG